MWRQNRGDMQDESPIKAGGESPEGTPFNWKMYLVVAATALGILSIALFAVSIAAQSVGGVYIGWGAVTLRIMQVPAGLLLALLLLVLGLGGIAYGLASAVRKSMRSSWFATCFTFAAGAVVLFLLWTLVLPASVLAPVRDVPYLVHPLEGTVIVTGVEERISYDSEGSDSSSYYVYFVPDDLPGYRGPSTVFRSEVSFGTYDELRRVAGDADDKSTSFAGYDSGEDLSGKPIFKVEMLPNTSTLISFEQAGRDS